MKSVLQIGILLILTASVSAFSFPQTRQLSIICQSASSVSQLHSSTTATTFSHQPLFIASSAMQASEGDTDDHPVTKLKRGINALRATMRTATGVSLTAMYVSIVAFTSGCVRWSMAFVLARFPTWVSWSCVETIVKLMLEPSMFRTSSVCPSHNAVSLSFQNRFAIFFNHS